MPLNEQPNIFEFLALLNSEEKLREEIRKNTDLRHKDVGDRVIVWDGSFSENVNTREKYCGEMLNKHTCIVIAINQNHHISYPLMDTVLDVTLDMVVWSPIYGAIRTQAELVKLVV